MMRNLIWTALFGAVLLSCSGRGASDTAVSDADTLTHHACYLTMAELADGNVSVTIADPWNNGGRLGEYLLVPKDSVMPKDVPDGVRVIRTPVDKAAVFSSVHTGAMRELGCLDALVAVADMDFFPENDTVRILVSESRIADVGKSENPSAERLAASEASVVLRSPIQGISQRPIPSGMVPVECADYMEDTPIGRSEWMLLFGELFGKRDEARRIFDGVIDAYSNLVFKAAGATSRKPKILVETEYSGVWYVPAGESYSARLYADAGADYPWANTKGSGSLALSLEEVASKAMDADIWLVRSFGYETTPETLRALNPRYASFAPVKNGGVYSCDTQQRQLFSEATYHPELLLADYISIFHPEVLPDYKPRYFLK